MKKHIMEKWVAALESNEYKQAREQLRDGNKFCCLGVLCNLHAQAHPKIAMKEIVPDFYLGESDCLPKEVMLWAGMDSHNGRLSEEWDDSLADMNDSGKKFITIAKVIRAHYKDL